MTLSTYPLPDTLQEVPRDASIAVLASGGVDSSVAVHLLLQAGFRPDLFYIRIGMEDEEGFVDCPAEEDMEMVTLLARKYQLHYEVIDLHKEYWERVVKYTIESVRQGLTPNPDIRGAGRAPIRLYCYGARGLYRSGGWENFSRHCPRPRKGSNRFPCPDQFQTNIQTPLSPRVPYQAAGAYGGGGGRSCQCPPKG